MPLDPIKNYQLDQAGVIVDQDPIVAPPGALVKAQNATNDLYGERGSLRKRPGLANFNVTATGNTITGGVAVPILLGSAGPIISNPFAGEAITVSTLTAQTSGSTTTIFGPGPLLGFGTTFDDSSFEYIWDENFDFSEISYTQWLDYAGLNNTNQLDVSGDNKTIQATTATTAVGLGYISGNDAWELFLTTDGSQVTDSSTTYTNTSFKVFPSNVPGLNVPNNWNTTVSISHQGKNTAILGNVLYYIDVQAVKTVRAFDGFTDKLVLTIPTGLAVFSLYAANNTLFVATIDIASSGANGGTDTGTMYQFNPTTGELSQLGAQFPAGHTPYSMTWAYSRLWVGTVVNDTNKTTAGRVYWIRPGIDTAFTLDHTFATGEMWVASLATFQGSVYAALLQAQSGAQTTRVMVRSTAGVWTNSTTSADTGGTVLFGFEDLLVWPPENSPITSPTSLLYATHYDAAHANAGGTIFKFDGTSWTTARTQDSLAVAILGFMFVTDPSSNKIVPLIAVTGYGGGSGSFAVSKNGTSWTTLAVSGFISVAVTFSGILIQVPI